MQHPDHIQDAQVVVICHTISALRAEILSDLKHQHVMGLDIIRSTPTLVNEQPLVSGTGGYTCRIL